MAVRDDDAATVTLTATELKPSTMEWSVEDIPKEFPVFKSLAKMWLEAKGVPDQKQYMFTLQILDKESLPPGIFPQQQ